MSKLIKNWTYLLFSDVSQAVINFFAFMVLARKLTPEGFGELNVVLALIALFTVFSNNVGANHVITREITLHHEATKHIFLKLVPLRAFSFIATSIALIIYTFTTKEADIFIIILSSVLILSNSLWDLSESIAFGYLVTKYTTLFNLIFSASWLLLIFIIPNELINVKLVLIIYCSLFVLKSIFYFIKIIKQYVVKNTSFFDIGFKAFLFMSFPYLWMRVLGSFVDQIPILLLDSNSGAKEVGYFSVGLRFIIPITLTVSTGLRAVFPFLTQLYHKDKVQFDMKVSQSFGYIFVWGSIIATILVGTSNYWIPFFFGAKYVNSIAAFNILAWFGVGLCFDLVLSTILSSTYKQKVLAIITTIDFVIMFPFLYIGAKHGATGLALSKLVSLLFIVPYHIIVINKVLEIKIYNKTFLYSYLFFIYLLILSNIPVFLWIKTILFLAVIVVYLRIRQSPLRQSLEFIALSFRNRH